MGAIPITGHLCLDKEEKIDTGIGKDINTDIDDIDIDRCWPPFRTNLNEP